MYQYLLECVQFIKKNVINDKPDNCLLQEWKSKA